MDTNALFNLSTFDSDCVVCMNLNDWMGSMSDQIKFIVPSSVFDENTLVEFEFMTGSGTIGTKQSFINQSLAMFCDCQNVSNKRKVQ